MIHKYQKGWKEYQSKTKQISRFILKWNYLLLTINFK